MYLYLHIYIYNVPSCALTLAASFQPRFLQVYIVYNGRTPRPCSVCGARRLSRRGDRRLVGARFGRWREGTFGRARWLTVRYSLPLSLWVDPLAEHIYCYIYNVPSCALTLAASLQLRFLQVYICIYYVYFLYIQFGGVGFCFC